MVLDAEGQMVQMVEDLPVDVGSLLWQQTDEYTYDTANQITGTGLPTMHEGGGWRTAKTTTSGTAAID